MNENRRQILEMLATGKITADEAERLISAIETEPPPASTGAAKTKPKYIRVIVDDNGKGTGTTKANIRVPHAVAPLGSKAGGFNPTPSPRARKLRAARSWRGLRSEPD